MSEKTKTAETAVFVFLVSGEIFIHYTDERFPFLLGRKGTFDAKGAYLSVI